MRFKSLSYENVFCYGNGIQKVDLSGDAMLWQIIGKNGVGKTSLIKMLKIVCYRELDGVKVAEVANQINRRGFIETEFESKGDDWKIRASFSPHKLEVWKNGSDKPEDWGSIDDTAKRIRLEVLDIPYYIFNNTISLSINDFKSFLTMKPVDARNIRDRIFGFAIINDMAELLKGNVSKYNALGSEAESKLETISESIVTSEEKYKSLEQQIKDDNQGKLDDLVEERESITAKYNAEKDKLTEKQQELSTIDLRIGFISNEIKKNTISDIKERVKDAEANYNQAKDQKKKISEDKDKLVDEKNKFKLVDTYNKLVEYESTLEDLKKLHEDAVSNMNAKKSELDAVTEEVNEFNRKVFIREGAQKYLIKRQLLSEKQAKQFVIDKELGEVGKKLSGFGEKKEIGNQRITESKNKIKEYKSKVDLYEKGMCPECETDLTVGEHSGRKEIYEADLEKEMKRLESLEDMMTKLESAITKAQAESRKVEESQVAITKEISAVEHEISTLVGTYLIPEEVLSKDLDGVSEWVKSKDFSDTEADEKAVLASKLMSEYEDIQSQTSKVKEELDKKVATVSAYRSQVGDEPIHVDGLKFNTEEAYTEEINKCIELYKSADESATKGYENLKDLETKLQSLEDSIKPDEDFKDVKYPFDLEDANNQIEIMKNDMILIEEEIKNQKNDLQEIENSITRLNVQIKEYSSGDAFKNQLESIKEIIDKFKADKAEKEKELEKYEKALTYYKVIQQILSDEGIKAYILKDIIPAINNEIASILSMLGVPITVVFDEEFKTHLYRFGQEVGLKTISTGQTKMIDCAILLSMTKIIKQKYSNTNVIFYDEVFSSIDSDYRISLLEIFKEICCDQLHMHTFMVNHAYMPSSYFDRIVPIVNEDGFSHISILTSDEYELRI